MPFRELVSCTELLKEFNILLVDFPVEECLCWCHLNFHIDEANVAEEPLHLTLEVPDRDWAYEILDLTQLVKTLNLLYKLTFRGVKDVERLGRISRRDQSEQTIKTLVERIRGHVNDSFADNFLTGFQVGFNMSLVHDHLLEWDHL